MRNAPRSAAEFVTAVIFVPISRMSVVSLNAVLAAGFPESVPATSVDRQCGSSQQSAHFAAQGVIAGANMVLVDFHPAPGQALVDGPQALKLEELPHFLEDVQIARDAYEQRVALARRYRNGNDGSVAAEKQTERAPV